VEVSYPRRRRKGKDGRKEGGRKKKIARNIFHSSFSEAEKKKGKRGDLFSSPLKM